MKTVYDLILEERERNNPLAKCDFCGIEKEKYEMWYSHNLKIYLCEKCFNHRDDYYKLVDEKRKNS